MKHIICLTVAVFFFGAVSSAQSPTWKGKFEQLGGLLPSPNEYRAGSGEPGPSYWQNRADYVIEVELNDDLQSIGGKETVTYHNQSPSVLKFLWLQLDQNLFEKESAGRLSQKVPMKDTITVKEIAGGLNLYDFDGGYKIDAVTDASGKPLPYKINQTMMRLELPVPLKKGEKVTFSVKWHFNVVDRMKYWARSGYEFFPEDGNYVYHIAQFFPRLCVFDDVEGWQNKQFLGGSEFALPFGDYQVKITVPSDHVVAATGTLQNAEQVLSGSERERFERAKRSFDKPVFVISEMEARSKESKKSKEKKTWIFKAENVRDFAFASSRKFIWDAMAVKVGNHTPLAMSSYPKEGNPLWEKESTIAVKNTLLTYSKHTIDYPYPVAISVHAPSIGMEYPMICFNYGRPNRDGSYGEHTRWALIGVVIHEVGHNFFPMIINSDERECTWMDEGLNSFVQYLTEVEHYPGFPHSWGPPTKIVPYMKAPSELKRPLMTGGDQVILAGAEQYAKAATALNILRETVIGPQEFDRAFKEYAERWAFKHPKPADFFRTLEDVSGVDLDWFWRGWFYTTDAVDMTIDNVRWFKISSEKQHPETSIRSSGKVVSKGNEKGGNDNPGFEKGPSPITLKATLDQQYGEFWSRINEEEIAAKLASKNIYEITLKNKGGLVMPVEIEFVYKDGSREIEKLPVDIWRQDEATFVKSFVKEKEVAQIVVNPNNAIADINLDDNVYPRQAKDSKFDQFKKSN
jgi:hypothetical protein